MVDMFKGVHKRGKCNYQRLIVSICDLEMTLYVPAGARVEKGTFWKSETLALSEDITNEGRMLVLIARRICSCEEQEYKENKKDGLIVRCNGKLVKTDKAVLRKVGVNKKDFLPCTLGIKKEDDVFFNAFLVCFGERAIAIDNVKSGTYLNVVARVKERRGAEGFELNLMNFELVERKTKRFA